MDHIPLLHAAQAFPFIDFLNKNGCPTEQYLRKAKLPSQLLEPVDGYIPEQQLWHLLDVVSNKEGLDDYGVRVGQQINIKELLGELVPLLAQQPTLHCMLASFCELVKDESSDAQFWLSKTLNNNEEQHWFCRSGIPGIEVGKRDAELYTLFVMIELVRLASCSDWVPNTVRLQTNDKRGLENWALLSNTNVKFSQKCTAIEIPSFVESSLHNTGTLICSAYQKQNIKVVKQNLPLKNFSGSLSQILELYLREEYFEIDSAAEIIGVSPRTLQRKLAKEGLNYKQLLDRARFKNVIPLLKDKNNKLIDIAFELGYSDPAHFTRAFKRWSGMSPSKYRQQFAA